MHPLINASVPYTDQNQLTFLKENERRHTQLIESLAAAIYKCNKDGYITFFNKAAVELWGRTPQIGKDLWCGSWKIFTPEGDAMLFDDCPMAKALKEGRSIRGQEILIERPDGVRVNVMPHPDPIFDQSGNVIEAVNMLVDITEIKRKENELRQSETHLIQLTQELEARVESRTKDLNEANDALSRSNKELEEFAFIASHDMQEPLRKIKAFSQKLENRNDALDEDSRTYIRKIRNGADRMAALIHDVLEFARMTHVTRQFIHTDLNEVVSSIIDDFEIYIEEKKATVKSTTLPTIKAVPLQMRQLFQNLIGNSLKFARKDLPCTIDIKSRLLDDQERNDHGLIDNYSYCETTITDNGIGFKQEHAETIFKIFHRLNHRSTYEGSGIGLALCRKIIGIHSGMLFATSEENVGTCFTVILPVDLH